MKFKFDNLDLKTKIFLIFPISFIISILIYYFFLVYLEKGDGEYCKTHYCLTIIPTEGYLSIVLGIISLIAVVLSLDSWKVAQKYNDEIAHFKNTLTKGKELKKFLEPSSRGIVIVWNQDGLKQNAYILNDCLVKFNYFNIDTDNFSINSDKYIKCIFDYLAGNGSFNSEEMQLIRNDLIASLDICINVIEEKFEEFKLK